MTTSAFTESYFTALSAQDVDAIAGMMNSSVVCIMYLGDEPNLTFSKEHFIRNHQETSLSRGKVTFEKHDITVDPDFPTRSTLKFITIIEESSVFQVTQTINWDGRLIQLINTNYVENPYKP